MSDAFLIKSAHDAFFCAIRKFLPANIFGSFLSDCPSFHLSKQILILEIHSVKPLQYTNECSN